MAQLRPAGPGRSVSTVTGAPGAQNFLHRDGAIIPMVSACGQRLTRAAADEVALQLLANAAAELDRFIGDPGPLLTVQDGVDVEV